MKTIDPCDQASFIVPIQGTLGEEILLRGKGVHTGQMVTLTIKPAPVQTGFIFKRVDLEGIPEISAQLDMITNTDFCTVIGHGNDPGSPCVSTIEHLLSALWSRGIDNAVIEIDGPEVPILDGSALPFINALEKIDIFPQTLPRPCLKILKPLYIEEHAERWIEFAPGPHFSIDVTLSFSLSGHAQHSIFHSGDCFESAIAPARTFAFFEDVQRMQDAGLIKGGSLDTALVIKDGRAMNRGGARFPNECARHKILDIIGDWALGGTFIVGAVRAKNPGHSLNHKALKALFDARDHWDFLSPQIVGMPGR